MRVLVAGWFSFEQMGATAGDLICRDLVVNWLRDAGIDCDVAVAPPFSGGVSWEMVGADDYSHVFFVCGPLGNGWPVDDFLTKFSGAELVGLNLTMLDDIENWDPFDLLLERDSNRTVRPDLTFLAPATRVPVVGLILADRQKEYGRRALHDLANDAINCLLESQAVSIVSIDTRLDRNRTGLRSPAEVESLIAKMDVVVTTRLHGTVLALKNGVPPLAIDPIRDGHKVSRQAAALDWPICLHADRLSHQALQDAFQYCLSDDARNRAVQCAQRARAALQHVPAQMMQQLQRTTQGV